MFHHQGDHRECKDLDQIFYEACQKEVVDDDDDDVTCDACEKILKKMVYIGVPSTDGLTKHLVTLKLENQKKC